MCTRVATGLLLALVLAGLLLTVFPQPALASGGGEGGEAGGLNPLNSWKEDLALWTAVIFLALLVVLGKFAWGPIVEGLDKREQGIADQVAQAERNNQKAQELLAHYEEKLAASEEDIRKMVEQGRREAEEAGRQVLDKARLDAKAEQERGRREIEAATAGALKELSEHSATLATQLAGKILGVELKAADHVQLIARAVAEMPKVGGGKNGKT